MTGVGRRPFQTLKVQKREEVTQLGEWKETPHGPSEEEAERGQEGR